MKKFLYYLQLYCISNLFMIALFEKTDLLFLGLAFLMSMCIITISERFILKATYYELFPFNLYKSGKYFLFLLTKIYSSGFSIIPYIVRGKSNPRFVEIYTDLESNVDLVVLSNSITLTPGTITVDLDGHKLLILWLNAEDLSTTEAGYKIKGTLESRIKEGL